MPRLSQIATIALVALALASPASASAAAAPRLTVSYPAIAVAGRPISITGRVTHARRLSRLRAQLQERAGRRWRSLGTGRVSRRGAFTLRWTIPASATRATLRATLRRGSRVVARTAARTIRFSHPAPTTPPAPGPTPAGTPTPLGAAPTPTPTPQPVSAPPVDVPPPADVASVPAPGQAGDVVVHGTTNVRPGDFLAIDVGDATPNGFFGRVTAVRTLSAAKARDAAAEDDTHLATEPASLTDAISDGAIDQTLNIDGSTGTGKSARLARGTGLGSATASCDDEAGWAMQAPTVSLTDSIQFHAHWSLFTLQTASLTGSVTAGLTMGAHAGAGVSCQLEQTLAHFDGKPISFAIGGIPVVLTPNASVELDADADATGTADAGLDLSETATAGVSWDHGSLSPIHSLVPSFTHTGPLVTGQAHVSVDLVPTINVLLYGVAGPQLGFSGGLDLQASVAPSATWDLTAPFDLTAQLVAPALGLATKKLDVLQKTYPVAHGTIAPPSGDDPDTNDAIHVGPYNFGTIEPGQTATRQLTATGGNGPYAFYLNTEDTTKPPSWVSLTPSGRLTMTPPAGLADGYTFYVYAVDATGQHSPLVRDTVTVTVAAAEPPRTDRPQINHPTVPEALWTVPVANSGWIFPTADGDVVTSKCTWHNPQDANVAYQMQRVGADGSLVWRRPDDAVDCLASVTDADETTYYLVEGGGGEQIRAVDRTGHVIWTSVTLPHLIDRNGYTKPVIGANGDVYFSLYDAYGHGYLVGVDKAAGTVDVDVEDGFPIDLFAYRTGLIVVDGNGAVNYVNSDGSVAASYQVPGIYFPATETLSATADGTLFMSGGNLDECGVVTNDGHFSVTKLTPAGVAWNWLAGASNGCERGWVAATPDGGVVIEESDSLQQTGHVESLDANGNLRWRTALTPLPGGSLFAAPPLVDTAGTLALPTYTQHPCAWSPSQQCTGIQVSLTSAATGATVLPRVTATATDNGEEQYEFNGDVAIDTDRVYVEANEYLDNDTYKTDTDALAALSAPGVRRDYQLATQLAVSTGGPVQ